MEPQNAPRVKKLKKESAGSLEQLKSSMIMFQGGETRSLQLVIDVIRYVSYSFYIFIYIF